jgi:hypothetical protein
VNGVEYYTASSERVFYADDNGNLHLTGEITATGGVFSGEI